MTDSSAINAIWGGMDKGNIKKLQENIRRKLGCRPGKTCYNGKHNPILPKY